MITLGAGRPRRSRRLQMRDLIIIRKLNLYNYLFIDLCALYDYIYLFIYLDVRGDRAPPEGPALSPVLPP